MTDIERIEITAALCRDAAKTAREVDALIARDHELTDAERAEIRDAIMGARP